VSAHDFASNDISMRREKLKIVPRAAESAEVAIGVAAEITAATLAPLTAEERNAVVKLLRKLGRTTTALSIARRPY
jgi:hypothetical protein